MNPKNAKVPSPARKATRATCSADEKVGGVSADYRKVSASDPQAVPNL